MKSISIIEAARKEYDALCAKADEIVAEQREHAKLGEELKTKAFNVEKRKAELAEFFRLASTVLPAEDWQIPQHDQAREEPAESLTFKDTIANAVTELLAGGKWLPIREIIAALEFRDIDLRADTIERKVQRVSSILHASDKFKGERGRGWALREEQLELPKGEARRAGTRQASVAV